MTLPHKWPYQPFECGCLLVRGGRRLGEAFRIQPDYLKDTEAAELEVNFSDLGVQLSRTSRALKLWMSLRYFGLDAFRRAIDRSIDLALLAQARIEASARLEPLTPAKLGVVCFRRRLDGMDEDGLERLNQGLVEGLAASGQGLISSTRLRGPLRAADVRAQPHQRRRRRGAGPRLARTSTRPGSRGRAAGLAACLRP